MQSSHLSPRAIDVSAEAVDAAVAAIEGDRRVGEAFLREPWPPLEDFLQRGGTAILLDFIQHTPGERCAGCSLNGAAMNGLSHPGCGRRHGTGSSPGSDVRRCNQFYWYRSSENASATERYKSNLECHRPETARLLLHQHCHVHKVESLMIFSLQSLLCQVLQRHSETLAGGAAAVQPGASGAPAPAAGVPRAQRGRPRQRHSCAAGCGPRRCLFQ